MILMSTPWRRRSASRLEDLRVRAWRDSDADGLAVALLTPRRVRQWRRERTQHHEKSPENGPSDPPHAAIHPPGEGFAEGLDGLDEDDEDDDDEQHHFRMKR